MQSVCFTESVDFGIVLHTFIFIVILIMQTSETSGKKFKFIIDPTVDTLNRRRGHYNAWK